MFKITKSADGSRVYLYQGETLIADLSISEWSRALSRGRRPV